MFGGVVVTQQYFQVQGIYRKGTDSQALEEAQGTSFGAHRPGMGGRESRRGVRRSRKMRPGWGWGCELATGRRQLERGD